MSIMCQASAKKMHSECFKKSSKAETYKVLQCFQGCDPLSAILTAQEQSQQYAHYWCTAYHRYCHTATLFLCLQGKFRIFHLNARNVSRMAKAVHRNHRSFYTTFSGSFELLIFTNFVQMTKQLPLNTSEGAIKGIAMRLSQKQKQ